MLNSKIAILGSISKATNLDAKGGVEVWTSLFLTECVKRGYTFDLYGIPGSINIPGSIDLIEIAHKGADEIINSDILQDKPLGIEEKTLVYDSLYARTLSLVKKNEHRYDFVIDSTGSPFFTITADEFSKPLVSVGHFGASKPYVKFMKVFPISKSLFYTFPSRRIYRKAKVIPKSQKFFIHEGINVNHFQFKKGAKTNLLWFGRIDPKMKKGADIAIEISKDMKIPLDIFTYIEGKKYFETVIKPLLHDGVTLSTDAKKSEYFNKSKVFVLPLGWEEPFGLVVPEAMAAGVPVVTYARGSMPELIVDGKTGFLVNHSDTDIRGDFIIKKTGKAGLIEAIKKIYAMDEKEYNNMRLACRKHVIENFTIEKMVDSYEEVFYKILNSKKKFYQHGSLSPLQKLNVKTSFIKNGFNKYSPSLAASNLEGITISAKRS